MRRSCRALATAMRRRSCDGRPMRAWHSGWRRGGWWRAIRVRDYQERLDFELDVIIKMEFPGYFLIVADFIKWAKAQGIPVGPGRGSGAGSLVAYVADHHRSRSVALQAAVRALPQSRTRVDARLRYRLLPGPARRGDRLRAGALWPGPCGADHHVRQAAGARGVPRRGPGAADALRAGGPDFKADPEEPGQSGDAEAGHRRRAAHSGRARPRPDGAAHARHRR